MLGIHLNNLNIQFLIYDFSVRVFLISKFLILFFRSSWVELGFSFYGLSLYNSVYKIIPIENMSVCQLIYVLSFAISGELKSKVVGILSCVLFITVHVEKSINVIFKLLVSI